MRKARKVSVKGWSPHPVKVAQTDFRPGLIDMANDECNYIGTQVCSPARRRACARETFNHLSRRVRGSCRIQEPDCSDHKTRLWQRLKVPDVPKDGNLYRMTHKAYEEGARRQEDYLHRCFLACRPVTVTVEERGE